MFSIFKRFVIGVVCTAFMSLAAAQTCGVPGLNGPVTPSGVVNAYYGGSGTAAAGTSQVNVASATGQRSNAKAIVPGDLVLIIQMQDGTTPANAGQHEYAVVTAVTGTTVSLNRPLTNTYVQNVTTNLVRTFQVVFVPQYSQAALSGTVTSDRWTIGTATGVATGGIVAMDVAGNLNLTGAIDVNGAGFRGGAAVNGTGNRAGGLFGDADYVFNTAAANGALKGEGTTGTPILVFDGSATRVNYATLLTQGYAAGGGGQAAQGNAGGGGNDGEPIAGNNQYNSGGGGGSNGGAGGKGGFSWSQTNDAGGRGAAAIAASVTRLVLGGGGGAGSTNNNGAAEAITVWPPTDTPVTRSTPPTTGTVNGASGAISSSGASGGGIVMVRAGTLTGAGAINANGYTAYNTSGGSEAAGGAGAAGSVSVLVGNATSGALTINAIGGKGGYSNYFDHGPGGGGGGGVVFTNFATGTVNNGGGVSGFDGCCSGVQGNGSPKAYNSVAGNVGTSSTVGGTPTGVQSGASCLPALTATKTALLSTVTAAVGATTTYSINISNTRGAATNVYLFDATLPPGWSYTSAPATVYTYSPAPPGAASAGAETTAATLPAGLPVNVATTVNTSSVTLRAAGAAPGVVPVTGDNSLRFGSFYVPQNGSVTVTFVVTIPDTATAGVYHNPAGLAFLDPTRSAADGNRLVSPTNNANANRTGTAYSANSTYAGGSTTAVAGSNFSGLVGGPTTDDVTLTPDVSVTKTLNTGTLTIGASGLAYTLVGRNNGRPVADQVYAATQATGQSATAIVSPALTITDTLPTGVSFTSSTNSNTATWTCTISGGGASLGCVASASVYPLAAASTIVTVTATISINATACPGPRTNTVSITAPTLGDSNLANNTATLATPVGCSANLSVTKTNGTNSVAAGGTTSYTVTFTNSGPAAADGAVIKDASSAGLSCSVASCTPSGNGVCPAPGLFPNLLTPSGLTLGSFASGSTLTFIVSCAVTATGQ